MAFVFRNQFDDVAAQRVCDFLSIAELPDIRNSPKMPKCHGQVISKYKNSNGGRGT